MVPPPRFAGALLLTITVSAWGCGRSQPTVPSIAFNTVPEAGEGGSEATAPIAGRVAGARPGQRIVLYARAGVWWVQPLVNQPFTTIQPDATWKSTTHLGTEYAALLVEREYQPSPTIERLPGPGGSVVAVLSVPGTGSLQTRAPKTLQFSGYEWVVRQTPSNRGGDNTYLPENASVDADGFLHLRITRRAEQWTSAEVHMTRSLGYGTYAFTVQDTSRLDPAATFGMFTFDDLDAEENHREVSVEISRWGDPANKNAQFLIQPYYVAANVYRFTAPHGRLAHTFRWEPGRASFRTTRVSPVGQSLAEHDFSAGVPVPGGESVRMNLYVYRHAPVPLRHEAEVVIEKFEYLP